MPSLARVFAIVLVAIFAAGQLSAPPASAQNVPSTGTVSGSVTDSSGAPVESVQITLSGPSARSTMTSSNGNYQLAGVRPGIYTITATKPGYNTATETDYVVIGGSSNALNVTLTQQTLSSLREIGRVTAGRRSTFNTSPASVAVVTAQAFADQGQPQVQRLLDQTPGIVIDHPGTSATNAAPGAITFPSIRGGLGFETASLIDGHPLSVGTFGDYVTTFLNSYVLGSVELIKGPGAAAPEVNYAIGGTVNFRTKDPTRNRTGQLVLGMDSNGGQFSNFAHSGTTTNGKLGWVLDYAVNGSPGPLRDANGYVTLGSSVLINGVPQKGFTTSPPANSATNGIQNNPLFANTTLLACCIPVSEQYNNKTELVKLKYKLSDVTTATASYLGSQTYTDQNGNHVYQYSPLFAPGASYLPNTGVPAGTNFPTWQNVFFPAYEWEVNNEPIFQAEVRSSLKKDVVLARYYAASINRLQYNSLDNPNASYTTNLNLYGTFTSGAAGNPVVTYNGQSVPVTFVPTGGQCLTNPALPPNVATNPFTKCAVGQAPYSYTSPVYFRNAEEDKLHGATFEYDHFIGATGNVISVAYDTTSSNTASYDFVGSPRTPTVPAGSRQTFATTLVRGIFDLTPKTNLTLSNYFDSYYQRSSANSGVTFNDYTTSRYDGRAALTYRPNSNTSYRFSAGSAIAPPYLFLLNRATTPGVLSQSGTFATNTLNNGKLVPETSFGYDIGGDIRFGDDGYTTLSFDAYTTNLFNQFISSATFTSCANFIVATQTCAASGGVPLISTSALNLANARYQGVELSLRRDPPLGFGASVQGALLKAYPYNLPPCFYSTNNVCSATTTNLAILPGANFTNGGQGGAVTPGAFNGVNNHNIPYSQGYAEMHFRGPKSTFASFGLTYYGNNNSLNVPAFLVGNSTLRVPLYDGRTTFQISADNLFGAYPNAFSSEFAGVPLPLANGKIGLTNANVIGPRLFRFILTRNFGQP